MIIQELVNHCLQLQDNLNSQINPNWIYDRSESDFYRAIWIECAEAIESLPWKWWKHSNPDLENLYIEISDIFHFILSLAILKKDPNLISFQIASTLDLNITDNKTIHSLPSPYDYLNPYLILYTTSIKNKPYINQLIELLEQIAKASLNKNYQELLFFFGLLVNKTIKLEKLYLLYQGKNILNKIRQEKGYNSGYYQKIINGIEDNKYLLKLISQINDLNELEVKLRSILNKNNNQS